MRALERFFVVKEERGSRTRLTPFTHRIFAFHFDKEEKAEHRMMPAPFRITEGADRATINQLASILISIKD